MTQWTITRDRFDHGAAVGTVGPSGAELTHAEIIAHPDKVMFKLYDDGGEHYYTGYMVGDSNEFAPLDDFGQPNAGCTVLKVC